MKHYKRKKLNIVNGSLTGLKTLIFGLVILIWMFGGSTISGGTEPPYIMVRPANDWVDGNFWPIGVLVTLTIDDPFTGVVVDHMDTQTVTESGQFRFELGGAFDIQPGHIVVVTDGVTTKEHIVTNLAVTSVDTQSDTVSGTADAGDQIEVAIFDTDCYQIVAADESGNWRADFSGLCDIAPGTGGAATEPDEDGDRTHIDWNVPTFHINVDIDIKPGSYPNSINLKSKGKIPVAILTTDTFDAATVDPTTVRFGATGAGAFPVHFALEDVDDDGDYDLILHFKTKETGIQCGDAFAFLIGNTFNGQAIKGADSIRTLGCK